MSDLFRSVMGGCSDNLVGSVVEAGAHRLNILKKVGEGGFAIVYRATSEHTGESVAVKRLLSNDSERKKDAIREASLLRKLNHKNIVKFITGKISITVYDNFGCSFFLTHNPAFFNISRNVCQVHQTDTIHMYSAFFDSIGTNHVVLQHFTIDPKIKSERLKKRTISMIIGTKVSNPF